MSEFINAVVMFTLSAAVTTGLATIYRHKAYFVDFQPRHLIRLRLDALLYVLLVTSTGICLAAAFMTYTASLDEYDSIAGGWSVLWGMIHAAGAIHATVLHVTINEAIDRWKVTETCKGDSCPTISERIRKTLAR